MSLIDEKIRLDVRARAATIIREAGNINIYMVAEATGTEAGKRRLDPYFDFEISAKLPSDSGVVSGDLIQCGNDYYLVMAIEQKWCIGELGNYRCNLYKCNSVISVYYFNTTTKKHDTLYKSGVRCLITQVRAQGWDDDKTLLIRQFRGRSAPFQIFAKNDSGILPGTDCVLEDQEGRRYRTDKEFDVHVAEGISQTQVKIESYS